MRTPAFKDLRVLSSFRIKICAQFSFLALNSQQFRKKIGILGSPATAAQEGRPAISEGFALSHIFLPIRPEIVQEVIVHKHLLYLLGSRFNNSIFFSRIAGNFKTRAIFDIKTQARLDIWLCLSGVAG